jgi:hypothetical protein
MPIDVQKNNFQISGEISNSGRIVREIIRLKNYIFYFYGAKGVPYP